MNNFMSLKILDRFKVLFEKIGVNYKVMRAILEIKLTMDGRRTPVAIASYNNKEKDENLFKKSLIAYGITGIFIMIFVIIPIPIYIGMSLSIGMLIFMLMTTMISDFSSVLLDVKSKNILLSRPIDEKTFNMSKIVHIFIYMFTLTIVMAGPSLIAGTIKHGLLFFLIYFIELILISGLIIFLTSLLYSFILKHFDGEKLKDIINYFQIILSIVMIIGYQFIGRMFNFIDLKFSTDPKWWNFLIPPAWFAAPFELFINGNNENWFVYLSLMAIIVPIISLIIHTKIVMPHFESNLLKLNSSSERGSFNMERKQRLHKRIANMFCFNKTENIFFRFSQNILSNERKLKLKSYPSLAFAAVFPFLTLINYIGGDQTFSQFISSLSKGKAYMGIYLSVFMLSSTVMFIESSENYKGSWIYKALPIESTELIYKGSIKGYFVKFCVPIFIVVSIIFLIIYKFSIIIDIILMFINMMLLIAIMFNIGDKSLPFSKDGNVVVKGKTGSFFFLLLVLGGLTGLHFLATDFLVILIAYTVVSLLINIFMWRKVFKVSWQMIN